MIELWNYFIYWLQDKLENRTFGAARSPMWEHARRQWIVKNPACAVCETEKGCEVHHKLPFHLHPERELDPTNFITLCRDHHYLFGHLLNWSAYNPEVEVDSKIYNGKIKSRLTE